MVLGRCGRTHHQPNYLKEGTSMLVLTRGKDETIVIDGCIRVTILGLKGNQVRLGISAPASVRVDREEVHDRLASPELRREPVTHAIGSNAVVSGSPTYQ